MTPTPYVRYATDVRYTTAARVTPFDEEVERWRREMCRDMTRAVVSLVLATRLAVVVRRWRR